MKNKYKYTVQEIDDLRESVRWHFHKIYNIPFYGVCDVEDKLRTYMVAGIKAKDIYEITPIEELESGI